MSALIPITDREFVLDVEIGILDAGHRLLEAHLQEVTYQAVPRFAPIPG